jgi:hypothetical protein
VSIAVKANVIPPGAVTTVAAREEGSRRASRFESGISAVEVVAVADALCGRDQRIQQSGEPFIEFLAA